MFYFHSKFHIVYVTNFFTCLIFRYKKQIQNSKKKKKHTDDIQKEFSNPDTRVMLSSRERRKIDRDERNKGQRDHFYYERVNVKNKNRDKKAEVDANMATRGHMKKKPKVAKK